jgi:light-regulated signal transduction histidine kinase (bacteriophytochrome)
MERENDTLDAAGLQVFGMISAAVSHDLKNVLAIINESAGLLDDLALRASKGVEIPADRLGVTTARILKQVKRGDTILKNLNRFAHTTDAPILQSNASETVTLMVDLAGRQAAMKELVFTTAPNAGSIRTCLVYFEAFIYLLLQQIIATLPRKEIVDISVEQQGDVLVIRFANANGLPLLADSCFAKGPERELMTWLKVEMDAVPGAVTVHLPADVG